MTRSEVLFRLVNGDFCVAINGHGHRGCRIKSAKRKDSFSHEVSQPSKRRRFDGDAGGNKVETQRAKPTGISSHLNACYINLAVQALTNVPRMVDHYRSLANRISTNLESWFSLLSPDAKRIISIYKYFMHIHNAVLA